MSVCLCVCVTGAAGVQELMEEAAEGGAVEVEVREEAGPVEGEAAEVRVEADLRVAPPQQPVIHADRHVLSAQAEIEGRACWAASRSRSSQHLSYRRS